MTNPSADTSMEQQGKEARLTKGKFNGQCNRTVCKRPAVYFNTSTRAYYCLDCARDINTWSIKDEGFAICFLTGAAGTDDAWMKYGQEYGS